MKSMTPRERVLAAVRHQPLDRFPTDIWAVDEVWQNLRRHFKTEDGVEILDRLGIDGIPGIGPDYHGPLISGPDPALRYDEWGFGYQMQEYNGGIYEEQVYFPMQHFTSVADLEKFPWPSPGDYDYSGLSEKAARYPDRAVQCGYWAIFYWHNRLRGLEQSLVEKRKDITCNLTPPKIPSSPSSWWRASRTSLRIITGAVTRPPVGWRRSHR